MSPHPARGEMPDGFLASGQAPTLAGVLPAVARALGHDLGPDLALTADDAAIAVPASDRVCVVLVDGMGWENVSARGGHAPFLRRRLGESSPVRSVYPTTTAANLAAFGTGRRPGSTGMLGYTVRHPGSGLLANLVSWTLAPAPEGGVALDPLDWQREPTVFDRLAARGARSISIGPVKFAGSGLTLAALRGAEYRAGASLEDRVDLAARAMREPGVALVYLYWGEVDATGHHSGWRSPEWGEQLAVIDAGLARLARSLPRRSAMVVTADHGMVDVSERVDVAASPALLAGVELVGGEPRACHLYCAEGQAARVAARWRDAFGERAWVLTRAEAEQEGLFGAVDPRHVELIGDVVVAAAGELAIVDSRTQSPASIALVGMHGSLTPAEVLVPALVEAP